MKNLIHKYVTIWFASLVLALWVGFYIGYIHYYVGNKSFIESALLGR